MSISLVAALGNPGREYEKSRHNLGWMVADEVARRAGFSWQTLARFEAEVGRWERPDGAVWIVKPLSFMNESGGPVQAFARFHQIQPEGIAAMYDDVAIPLGLVKVSEAGGPGGHNGVASLLQHVGEGFVRYRLGIGPREPKEMDLKDFVLGRFNPDQLQTINQNLNAIIEGLDLLLSKGAAAAMNLLNRRESHESE